MVGEGVVCILLHRKIIGTFYLRIEIGILIEKGFLVINLFVFAFLQSSLQTVEADFLCKFNGITYEAGLCVDKSSSEVFK